MDVGCEQFEGYVNVRFEQMEGVCMYVGWVRLMVCECEVRTNGENVNARCEQMQGEGMWEVNGWCLCKCGVFTDGGCVKTGCEHISGAGKSSVNVSNE